MAGIQNCFFAAVPKGSVSTGGFRRGAPGWLSVREEHLAERETIRWEEQSILGPEEGAEVHCGQGPGRIFIRFFLI